MSDLADTTTGEDTTAASTDAPADVASNDNGGSLVTDGAEKKPDTGDGEKKPDAGDGEKKPDTGEAKEGDKAPEGAPETYTDFTVPEGVVLNQTQLESFQQVARDLNLPQEAAQKLVDQAVEMRKADAAAVMEVRQSWIDASKSDKEFGGDKLDQNLATAKRALDAYGSPELKTFLEQTGAGNNPEIIRLLVKVGATVTEDTKHVAGRPALGSTTLAERLYPTAKKE